ncbi:MAG: 4-hydroxyacetophenone monooxygenase, partial [Oceanobacter sp.]
DVRKKAQDDYNTEIQHRLSTTVWNTGGCYSWYLNDAKKNTTLWPGHTYEYRKRLQRINWKDFTISKS